MKTTIWLLISSLCLGAASHAQPAGDAPKIPNPPNAPFAGMGGQNWQNLSPKQRRDAMRQSTLQTLRGSLSFLGFTDKTTLDAIEATALQQEKILAPVRLQQRELVGALAANTLPVATLNVMGEEFLEAIARAREERQKTILALEKKIGFSKNTRLAAVLRFSGVTGDESSFLGGIGSAIFGTTSNYFLGQGQTTAQLTEEKNEAEEGAEEVRAQLEAEFPVQGE